MSDYREPWVVEYGINDLENAWCSVYDDKRQLVLYDSCDEAELPAMVSQYERIVACVNAMKGIEDPEAFMEHLKQAAKAKSEHCTALAQPSIPNECTKTPCVVVIDCSSGWSMPPAVLIAPPSVNVKAATKEFKDHCRTNKEISSMYQWLIDLGCREATEDEVLSVSEELT
jgi:hypothetical protein